MFPFPNIWGCKYTYNILIINNFINNFVFLSVQVIPENACIPNFIDYR